MNIYDLAEYLPDGVHWGDEITPIRLEEIVTPLIAATRRADRKARLECERIALQYSQAYGQIDDAMAIAREIRATIPEE